MLSFFSPLYKTIEGELSSMNKTRVDLKFFPDLSELNAGVIADRFRLKQVLLNLLRNSIKFTDSGNVIFGYKFHPETVEFYVEDTGSGIPQTKLDKVVEPFRQVNDSSTSNDGGIGLGYP